MVMKIPLRYQDTEYDCGTTSFINALAYLYDREDFPVELLKQIYRFTLDVKGPEGITGEGGTSKKHAELLSDWFVKYANQNNGFGINCKVLKGKDVTIENIKAILDKNGVAIARCWQESEHYVIITKIDNYFAYIFDPYYLDKDYYLGDEDIVMIFHEEFTHNRLVKTRRLFDESHKDYSLLEESRRSVILLNR